MATCHVYLFHFSRFPHDAHVCCPNCLERDAGPEGETCDGYISTTEYHLITFIFKLELF